KSNQRVSIPLDNTPLIRPVNQFIQSEAKAEALDSVQQQDVSEEKEAEQSAIRPEQRPADLFSHAIPRNPAEKEKVIKHTLMEEEESRADELAEADQDQPEFVIKQSETEFHFEVEHVQEEPP